MSGSFISYNGGEMGGGGGLSSSFSSSRWGSRSRGSLDWDRITDEVELRTTHLLNTSRSIGAYVDAKVPPLPPKTPNDPSGTTTMPSDFIERLRREEEGRIKEEKVNDALRNEIESLKITGTQQRERIMQLESNVAELTAMYKEMKSQSAEHVNAQKSLATQMYTMNESWVGTSSDLKLQINNHQQLEQRVWNMEQDSTSPAEIHQIERNQKDLQEQLKDVSATADAAALRGYQTAFFSDTLLAALEEMYKGKEAFLNSSSDNNTGNRTQDDRFSFSKADQSTQEPSRAVQDMVSLMNSAMQASAMRAMHNDEKLKDSIKDVTDPIVRAQVGDKIKNLQEENEKSKYPKMYSDMKKELCSSIAEDPNFVQKLTVSVRSAIPPAVEEVDFMKKVESIVNPLVARKVENKTVELLKEATVENEDVRLRIARLDDGLSAQKIIVDQIMERQLQLPSSIQNDKTFAASTSTFTTDNNDVVSTNTSPKAEAKGSGVNNKASKGGRTFARSPKGSKAKATTNDDDDDDEDAASVARLRAFRDRAEMRTETKSLLDHQAMQLRAETRADIDKLDTEMKDDLTRMDADIKSTADKLDRVLKEKISNLEEELEKRMSVLITAQQNSKDDNYSNAQNIEENSNVASDILCLTENVNELLMAKEVVEEKLLVLKDSVEEVKSDNSVVEAMESMEKKFDGGLKSMQECLDVLQGEMAEMDDKLNNFPTTAVTTKPKVPPIDTAVIDPQYSTSSSSCRPHQLHAPIVSPPPAVAVAEAIMHAKHHEEVLSARSRTEEEEQEGGGGGGGEGGAHQQQQQEGKKMGEVVGRASDRDNSKRTKNTRDAEDIPNIEDYSEDGDEEVLEKKNEEEEIVDNDSALNDKDMESQKDDPIREPAKVTKSVHVFVKTFVGKIVPLVVEEEETILSVKSKIASKEGMVAESQRLIFNGQELMDFGCVSDYNLVMDSTIHLKLKAPTTTPIISVNEVDKSNNINNTFNSDTRDRSFNIDDDVEGKFGSGSKWFKGVIKAVNNDGTYQIFYDDGDKEEFVPVERIRYPKEKSPRASPRGSAGGGGFSREPSPRRNSAQSSPLAGLRMKASPLLQPIGASPKQPSPKQRRSPTSSSSKPYFQAPLSNDSNLSQPTNLEESMDSIGSLGELVLPARVKKLQEKRRKEEADAIKLEQAAKNIEQEKIEKNQEGEQEKEKEKSKANVKAVDHSHIPKSAPPPKLESAEHELEELIEHPETVPDTLQEDDGIEEIKEKIPDATPPVSNYETSSPSKSSPENMPSSILFEKNDAVLAVFEAKLGRTRWFPGRIAECNIDGTYDVKFNDGDAESGISPEHIIAAVGDDQSPPSSSAKSPRPKAAEGLVVNTTNSPQADDTVNRNASSTSSNQEPSPSIDPWNRQTSSDTLGAVQGDNDELSNDDLSVPSDDDVSLHQFDTDSDIEVSSDTDPAMKGISKHLRRGTAQEESKSNNDNDNEATGILDGEDASRNLHEPGIESDYSNASTPSKPSSSSSPRAAEVDRNIGGDALAFAVGVHEARARTIRQMSPRNTTPGSVARIRGLAENKDAEDEKHQDETNKTLENMDISVDTDEDERILEGTGRENIWDKIQLSSGKRINDSEHILSSPKQSQAPPSPFSQIANGSRDTPVKQQAKGGDVEESKGKGKSKKSVGDIKYSGDDYDDLDGQIDDPATSSVAEDKETLKSPSAVLTEALKTLQSDPSKNAAAATAKAMAEASSPEPVLTGVLRRRKHPKKIIPPSTSTTAETKISSLTNGPETEEDDIMEIKDVMPLRTQTEAAGVSGNYDEDVYDSAAIREAAKRAINASVSAVKYSEAREAAMGGTSVDDDVDNNYRPGVAAASVPKISGSSQCNFCLKKIQNFDMSAHLKVCTLRYEHCSDCGTKVRYIKMAQHLKDECFMRAMAEEGVKSEDDDEVEEDHMIQSNESKDYDDFIVERDI